MFWEVRLTPRSRGPQDDERRELLQMSEAQLEDVARFCNRYPDIQMAHQVADAEDVRAGEQVQVTVQLEREMSGAVLQPVDAQRCAPLAVPWPQTLALNPGPEHWPRALVPSPGPEPGPRALVPNPGPKAWPQALAPSLGPKP